MTARLEAYCRRVGLDHPPAPDAGGLAKLQAAHRQSITFENIDVLLGREIAIDSDAVFDKLVTRGRGGYCFEQNRLYADMLAEIGIATRPLLARPRLAIPEGTVPPRTHVLLLAEIEGAPWIADAGFGGSFVAPLPLVDGATTRSADGADHRLRRIDRPDGEWLLERRGSRAHTDGRATDDPDWQGQYSFDLAPVMPADLMQANHWTANWPQSRFRETAIVSLVLPEGFVSLTGTQLRHGGETRSIAGAAEWREVMQRHFGLALSPDEVARLPMFAI